MLPHLAARLFGTPLLVQRAKLDVILAVLSERLHLAAPDVALAPPLPRAPNPAASASSSIAVLPIHGTLVKRTLGLEAASGLTSYAEIGARLEAALGDPLVAGIVLDIDSPGGETGGCFEVARRVREAAGLKPVWAVANDAAFSAAYAIGCAAERLFVTETGGVGSIGVIALHVDQSAKDAQDGLRYTAITAGARKNDYSPHEPLADAARAALQAEVDRLHALFVAHVAAMRGLPEDVVRATEAALFFGPQAARAGLADGVVSESELQGLQQWLADHGHLRGCWPYDELSSVVGHVLADGRIDAAEQRFLLQAFAVYAAQDADRAERDAASQGMPTLASLCTPVIDLQVAGKRCCLVGHSVHYPPALFAARVTALGGTPVSRVGPGTDVVVVGAESNPGWRYALFGRELDQALALQRAGEPLLIVHEEDFHRAAQALG